MKGPEEVKLEEQGEKDQWENQPACYVSSRMVKKVKEGGDVF